MENVHEKYAGIHIYLDTKSQSRLEDVCQNLQKKLSSVFEQTNRNYDVTDKKATVKKKSKTPKKNVKKSITAGSSKLKDKSLAKSATCLFINTQPESQSQESDFNNSVHDESLNAFEDEITKGDTVNENTPNSKESSRKSKMQSGRKVKRKTTLKNKNLSKDKVPKSLEKKVSKSTRNHHVELKGKKAQKRNRGKSIEITADTKADVKKTALNRVGDTTKHSAKKTEPKVPKSRPRINDNEYNSSIFSDSDDELVNVDSRKGRGQIIPETAPEDDFGNITDENTYTEAESEDEINKKTASRGKRQKKQNLKKRKSSRAIDKVNATKPKLSEPKARKKAAVSVKSKCKNRQVVKSKTTKSRKRTYSRAKKVVVEENSCDEGKDENVSKLAKNSTNIMSMIKLLTFLANT